MQCLLVYIYKYVYHNRASSEAEGTEETPRVFSSEHVFFFVGKHNLYDRNRATMQIAIFQKNHTKMLPHAV